MKFEWDSPDPLSHADQGRGCKAGGGAQHNPCSGQGIPQIYVSYACVSYARAEPVSKDEFAKLVEEAQHLSGAADGLTGAEIDLLFKVTSCLSLPLHPLCRLAPAG